MDLFKSARAVASINWHRWKRDIRIWFIFFFTILMVDRYLRGLLLYGLESENKVTFCMLPFLFISTNMSINAPKMVFHICMLLLLCDAPFFHPITPYTVLRSRRNSWWVGECIYIIGTAFFYMLFLTLVSSLYVIPIATFQNDWGDAAYALIYGDGVQSAEDIVYSFSHPVPYPSNAIIYLYPFASQIYTFVTGWATFTFLGLVLYFVSLVKRNVVWGLGAAGIFIFLEPTLNNFAKGVRYWWQAFSPVCWNTVDYLDVLSPYYFISIPFVTLMYPTLIVLLLIAIWYLSKKTTIELY